jgi:hypothetical protein
MAAQTIDRPRAHYGKIAKPMKIPATAGALVREGVMVSEVSGLGLETVTATTHNVLGVSRKRCDNTGGAAAAKTIEYDEGDFAFENSAAADALANADIGNLVYAVDNNTVAKTDGTSTRSVAGRLMGFMSDGRPIVRVGSLAK